MEALQHGLADGEALGVALQYGRRLLRGARLPVRLVELSLATLPVEEEEEERGMKEGRENSRVRQESRFRLENRGQIGR